MGRAGPAPGAGASALGVAASTPILGIGLQIARGIYLNSVPSSTLPTDAAAAAFDALVHFLGRAPRGPGGRADRRHRGVLHRALPYRGPDPPGPTSGIDWVGTSAALGPSAGPAGHWTYLHRKALRIGAVALAALIFVFLGEPTVPAVIVIVVVLLIVLGLIELIGVRPPRNSRQLATRRPDAVAAGRGLPVREIICQRSEIRTRRARQRHRRE